MNNSRTANVLKNSSISIIGYLVGILVAFATRTVFTLLMGTEYLGVSGLFTNILTILSFAELGIGTAIVYRLYAPLAAKDYNKLYQFLGLYKKLYRVIALTVLCVGLAIIPFLEFLVKAPSVVEDVRLLYVLYLIQTVTTYVYSYKKSLLIADQKQYIVTTISEILNIVLCIAQCVFLVLTHNFIIYLLLQIIFSFLTNVVCSVYADRKYGLRNVEVKGELSQEEKDGLKKDVKGLLITKIASTTFNGTDNLFISGFIGISYVGILSNYTLILTTVNGVLNKVFGSITASIGNLVTTGNSVQVENVLKRLYFINATIYCYICTGMFVLIREFVTEIWLNNEFFLSMPIILLAIFELLLRGLHYPLHTTQLAMGLFSQYKIMYLVAAILNIVLDFILVKPLGIAGLYIATIFCRCIIWITDIYVVYKFGYNKSPVGYYMMLFRWLLFLSLCTIVSYFICSLVTISGIAGFAIRFVIVNIVYFVAFFTVYGRKEEFVYFKQMVFRLKEKVKK